MENSPFAKGIDQRVEEIEKTAWFRSEDVGELVYHWTIDKRITKQRITRKAIRLKAIEIYKTV